MPTLQRGPLRKRLQKTHPRVKLIGSEPLVRTSELDTPAASIEQITPLSALSPKPQRQPKNEVCLHLNNDNLEASALNESMDDIDRKFKAMHEALDKKINELSDEVSSEEVLHFQTSKGREDTLLIKVIIKGEVDHEVMAFVDSGATFSLINETCLPPVE